MKLFEIQVRRVKSKVETTSSLDQLFQSLNPAANQVTTAPVRQIKVGPELQKKNGVYQSIEYTRREKRFIQIGVEIEASRIAIKDMPEIQFVLSSTLKNVWYELSNIWYEDGYATSQSARFGMNACGRFIVEAYDEDDIMIAQEVIVIYPQTMSFEQYEIMQAEVRELFRVLDTRPGASDNERDVLESLFPLERIEQYIYDLQLALDEIIDAPMEALNVEKTLLSPEQIKRWTSRTLIEHERKKGQPKVQAEVTSRHTNIPEHQMIRLMLETISELLHQAEMIERSKVTSLENEEQTRRSKLGSSREESGVIEALRRKYTKTQNDREFFKKRTMRLRKLLDVVDSFLVTPLFEVEALDIEETHLSVHDTRYNEVFELYEAIQSLTPQLNPQKQAFVQQMTNSPLLFEVWTLLQLCQELKKRRFRTVNQSVTDLLLSHHERYATLSGVRLHFTHADTTDQIWLAYEHEVFLQHLFNEKRKPDFLLSYAVEGDMNRRNIHVLDAKYKPYGAASFTESLKADLDKSARRYMADFLGEGMPVRSASLVHSDISSDIHHWNITPAPEIYAYSHFPIAPGQNEHLNTYIKRIVHHHNHRHEICPSCGSVTEGIPKYNVNSEEPYKWTYICTCDEVWVNNRCRYGWRHEPSTLRDVRLIKYATGNYNWQVDQGWDVHCPVCHKNYHGLIRNPGLTPNILNDEDLPF
jgi:hypothetical protein